MLPNIIAISYIKIDDKLTSCFNLILHRKIQKKTIQTSGILQFQTNNSNNIGYISKKYSMIFCFEQLVEFCGDY
jgi:hypothetical protein